MHKLASNKWYALKTKAKERIKNYILKCNDSSSEIEERDQNNYKFFYYCRQDYQKLLILF